MVAQTLVNCGIRVNKKKLLFDAVSPFITSGIRKGAAACATMGMDEKAFDDFFYSRYLRETCFEYFLFCGFSWIGYGSAIFL